MSKRLTEYQLRRLGMAHRMPEPENPYIELFDPPDRPDDMSRMNNPDTLTIRQMSVHGRAGNHPSMHYPGDQRRDAEIPLTPFIEQHNAAMEKLRAKKEAECSSNEQDSSSGS